MEDLQYRGIALLPIDTFSGLRFVDIGNYYEKDDKIVVVVASKEIAKKYFKFIDVPIYIKKEVEEK